MLQLRAPANTQLAVQGVTITFDGINPSAKPIFVELVKQQNDGTFGATAPLLSRTKPSGASLQASGAQDASVEPSLAAANAYQDGKDLAPSAGLTYTFPLPDGERVLGGGERLGVRCTLASGETVVNARVQIDFEE